MGIRLIISTKQTHIIILTILSNIQKGNPQGIPLIQDDFIYVWNIIIIIEYFPRYERGICTRGMLSSKRRNLKIIIVADIAVITGIK